MQNSKPQNTQLQQNKPYIAEIQKAYGAAANFLVTFNCGKQYEYVKNALDLCFVGKAPSINRVIEAYGHDCGKDWLSFQLIDLAFFCGIKDKPTPAEIQSATDAIIINYGYLKVTEFMVFFQRFKGGEYGRFFGAFDSMVVTTALKQFIEYRRLMLTRIEARGGRL